MAQGVAERIARRRAAKKVSELLEGMKGQTQEEQLRYLRGEREKALAVTQIEVMESSRLIFGDGDDVAFNLTDPSRDDGEVWDELGIYPRIAGLPTMRTEQDLEKARDVCRWLAAENSYALGAHENRISYITGGGLKVRVVPRDPDLRGPKLPPETKKLQKQVQAEIDRFRETEMIPTLEQEGVRRADRDGEFFLRRFWNATDTGVVRVRYVEPEDVKTPTDKTAPDSRVSFGIETAPDDALSVLAYHVVRLNGTDFARVPADEIVHLKLNVDMNAMRGWPTLYPVRRHLARAEKLLRNMAYVAAIQAAIALIVSHENATESQITDFLARTADAEVHNTTTGRVDYMKEWKPGQRVDLPAGTKFEGSIHNANAADNVAVLQADLRGAAVRLNWPEYMFTGDASNANYASTQIAESPHVMTTKRTQGYFEMHWIRVHEWAVENAVRANRLPASVREDFKLSMESPSLVVRDIGKEAQANGIKREHGVLSVRTWQMQDGLDPETEEANLAAERAAMATGTLGDPEDPNAPLTIDPGALGPEGAPAGQGVPAPGTPVGAPAVPGAPGQPPMAAPAGGQAQAVQDTALNGAQVTALQEIVQAVASGQLPGESAKAMILASFPRLGPDAVNKIVDPAVAFTPELTPEQEAAKVKAEQPTVVAGPGAKPKPGRPVVESITVLQGPKELPRADAPPFLDMLMGSNFGELRGLMRDVHAGAVPTEAAVAFVATAFPMVPPERVQQMFSRIVVAAPALTVAQAPPTIANPTPPPAPIGASPGGDGGSQTIPTGTHPGQDGDGE